MRQWTGSSFLRVMACHYLGARLLHKKCWFIFIRPLPTKFSEISIITQRFSFKKRQLKCHLQNMGNFAQVWMCSWWPGDAIWRHKSRPTLDQVMACYLMTPRHYLHQRSLIITKILRQFHGKFLRYVYIHIYIHIYIYILEIRVWILSI